MQELLGEISNGACELKIAAISRRKSFNYAESFWPIARIHALTSSNGSA